MSQWAGGVLTAAGRTLQAKVEAGTTPLVLTKIKLGDGTESMDAVDNLTDLVGAKAVLGISSAVSEGDHATITGVVLSTQLQAGFMCREWGLFAQDPVAGEILYMITIDNQPEWLPASTAAAQVSATYAMNIAVANATNIEVQIDPAGLVDVEMLDGYLGLSKRSHAYALGDTALLENIPAGYFLECTTAGISGATTPVITPPVTAGQTVNDGNAVWTVRQCLSTNGGILIGNVIARNGDNASLKIVGGTTGAFLDLNGINNTGANAFKGGARLYATNGDNLWGKLGLTPTGLFFIANGTKTDVDNYAYDLGSSAIVEKSLTPDGYIKRASGEILQWGTAPVTSGVATVTYPISFTSRYSGHCFAIPSSTNFQASVTYGDFTASGCKIYVSNNSINSIHYIAVGY